MVKLEEHIGRTNEYAQGINIHVTPSDGFRGRRAEGERLREIRFEKRENLYLLRF